MFGYGFSARRCIAALSPNTVLLLELWAVSSPGGISLRTHTQNSSSTQMIIKRHLLTKKFLYVSYGKARIFLSSTEPFARQTPEGLVIIKDTMRAYTMLFLLLHGQRSKNRAQLFQRVLAEPLLNLGMCKYKYFIHYRYGPPPSISRDRQQWIDPEMSRFYLFVKIKFFLKLISFWFF